MPLGEIVGHAHLLELLAAAATRQSLPPSLIFAGPDGVGKRMAAVALAQLLNCLKPTATDACGTCPACKRIARGVHADVLMIEPGETGSIKIDQVRDAIERAAYRPFEGRRRVVIVDEADAMVIEAQNALLKTLEEPPDSSMFILVTSRPDLLLPTVLSRCQRLRFGRLSPGDIAAVLMRSHGYEAADAHASASASDGSIGAALDGSSEGFVDARDAAMQLLQTVSSSTDPRRRLDGARTLAGGSRSGVDRDELARRLRSLATMLRDIVLLKAPGDDRWLANGDLKPVFKKLLHAFDAERALRGFAAVDKALDALDRNASPKIVADWIAFQL